MNEFQKAFSAPVDMDAEVKAYEEAEALERGDVVPPDESQGGPELDPGEPSASVSEAADSEAPDDVEIEAEPGKKHPGNAWKAMREKLKASDEANRQLREEMARQEGERRAWATWQAQQQAQAQQQPEPFIDHTINPVDAIGQQRQLLERTQAETAQLRQYIQQQELMGQVQNAYRADAARYMAQQPEFKAAYDHAFAARTKQLMLSGATQAQAVEQTRREEMDLAYASLQAGRSPAETMYQYATQVYGYRPNTNTHNTQPRAPNGQFIEQEQAKAAAATTIARGGTVNVKSGMPTMEEVAAANGDKFDELYEKLRASEGKAKISWR